MHVVSSSHLLNAALHVLKLISIIWSGIKFLSIGRSNFAGSKNIENDKREEFTSMGAAQRMPDANASGC